MDAKDSDKSERVLISPELSASVKLAVVLFLNCMFALIIFDIANNSQLLYYLSGNKLNAILYIAFLSFLIFRFYGRRVTSNGSLDLFDNASDKKKKRYDVLWKLYLLISFLSIFGGLFLTKWLFNYP